MRLRWLAPAVTLLAAAGGAWAATTVEPRAARAQHPLACAPHDRHIRSSARAGSDTQLVPPGATSLVLCRYTPLGGPRSPTAGSLIVRRLITNPRTTARLAGRLNALPVRSGAFSCPADWGENIVAVFRYPSGADDPVTVDRTGCQPITNGHVHRLGLDARIVSELSSLAQPPASRLRVRLRVCGGPAPGRCRIESFTDCSPNGCARLDQVEVSFEWTVAPPRSVRLHHGRASLTMPAGRYTVQLFGEGRGAPQPPRPVQTRHVTTRAHRASTVTFMIAVP